MNENKNARKISDELLAEFLDWSLVNDCKDFELFKKMKKAGSAEVTREQLEKKVKLLEDKSKKRFSF